MEDGGAELVTFLAIKLKLKPYALMCIEVAKAGGGKQHEGFLRYLVSPNSNIGIEDFTNALKSLQMEEATEVWKIISHKKNRIADIEFYEIQRMSSFLVFYPTNRAIKSWVNVADALGMSMNMVENFTQVQQMSGQYSAADELFKHLKMAAINVRQLVDTLIEIDDEKYMPSCMNVLIGIANDVKKELELLPQLPQEMKDLNLRCRKGMPPELPEVTIVETQDVEAIKTVKMESTKSKKGGTALCATDSSSKQGVLTKTLEISFALHVLKETYLLGIVPWSTEYRLKPEDCKLNSPVHKRIVGAIHKVFEDLMLESSLDEPDNLHEVHVHPPTFVKQANYLSLVISIENSDGTPISKKYKYYDKPASRKLWDQIESEILKAATYDDFETKVDLEDWRVSSIIMIVNITKNINCLWRAEEVDVFLERATKGLRELQLDPPLQFVSVVPDDFLKYEIDVISPHEYVIEAVKSFSHTFEKKLLNRSVNGDPNFEATLPSPELGGQNNQVQYGEDVPMRNAGEVSNKTKTPTQPQTLCPVSEEVKTTGLMQKDIHSSQAPESIESPSPKSVRKDGDKPVASDTDSTTATALDGPKGTVSPSLDVNVREEEERTAQGESEHAITSYHEYQERRIPIQKKRSDSILAIQSERVKRNIQNNPEISDERMDNKAATLVQSEKIKKDVEARTRSFVDDGTEHYHRIAGKSWYVWSHHSTIQNPSKLLNNALRSKYIPVEDLYQLYEDGDTRLYSIEELESKFLEKFRTMFSIEMERQPWLFSNLHKNSLENKEFYEFCKKVEKYGMSEKYSFLLVDYRYAENLFHMHVDVKRLKEDLDVADEDSKSRVLMYLGEKKMMFNMQFVQIQSEDNEKTKRHKIVDAIQKGQTDLKLFSALYLDLLQKSDICLTCLVAVNGVSKEELNQLMICNDCTENLVLLADDLKDVKTLKKKLDNLVFQHNQYLELTAHAQNIKDLYEILSSKIYASLCIRNVYLPKSSHHPSSDYHQNTLTQIYLNNDQMHFMHLKDKHVILKGCYGSGKSTLAQLKFKEKINRAGPNDHLYYIVFSDDSLYTSVVRSSLQSSLPERVNKDQIHILNTDEYKKKFMTPTSTESISIVLDDILQRHSNVKDSQITLIIDEFDGSLLTKEEALNIKSIIDKYHYVLIALQSMQVSRTKIKKAGLLEIKKTSLEGHQFDYTGMAVTTLNKVMRNTKSISELSRAAIKMLERLKNRYYERDIAKENSGPSASRTTFSLASEDISCSNTQKDLKQIQASNEIAVPVDEGRFLQTSASFDHSAKIMSNLSQSYTGVTYESRFQFNGNWTDGHSIKGHVPKLIYPFSSDVINYTTVNNDINRLRMFFTLKHLVQIENYVGGIAIIAFDAIDAQLISKILTILKVPSIVYAPALLLRSNQTLDNLRNSLDTHILVTDHIGARGMEFKRLLVVCNPNENHLQSYLVEALTRATSELSFLLINKEVQNLKEDGISEKESICNKIIKEWVRQKLVVEQKVNICGTHKVEDLTAGSYCKNNDESYGIHPSHKDFRVCSKISRIEKPRINAINVMKQIISHFRTLFGQQAGHALVKKADEKEKLE